jgi:hypothetical protein
MATAPISRKLNLTRDQLAAFLTDQQQIRQFELLFATVDTLQVITGTDFEFQADSAAATANEALAQISALRQSVELLQLAPPPREFKRTRYGSFYDTTTQTATVINTATAITFNTTDLSNGVFIGSPTSRIIVDSEGVYNFALSFQIDKTSGGTAEFYIWFRLNGVNIANSAGFIRIQGNNAEIFSAYNLFLDLKANDYIEIMFSVTDLSLQVLAVAATAPVPAIPSIILTVNNIEGAI